MKFLLTIFFISLSYCYSQAQAKYYWGKNESGKTGWYAISALPMQSVVQTVEKRQSDSLKVVYQRVADQAKKITALEKRNKILTDSIKILSIPDTTRIIGNGKVRQVRKHYSELEIQ